MEQGKTILFGDEMGLAAIREALPGINVSGIVYSGRRRSARQTAIDLARQYVCDAFEQPEKESDEYASFIIHLAQLAPRLGLCCSYDLILDQRVLSLFSHGIFNVHGALLPKYRGANVLNWVLVNGEKETGVTLHKMVAKVDAGPIVLQKKVIITPEDTAVSLRDRMTVATVALIKEAWPILSENVISMHEQHECEATFARRRKPEDGKINWNKPTEEIYNLIRALVKPWPGAWYSLGGRKVIIDEYKTLEEVRQLQKSISGDRFDS